MPGAEMEHANGNGSAAHEHDGPSATTSTFRVKAGLAQMLKGGVIMGTGTQAVLAT
jgi:hypothetical protein